MTKPRIAVQYRKIADLQLDPRNARLHPEWQVDQIAESLRTFGFVVPALIDKTGKVITGHGRLRAAKKLGQTEVPTVCLAHLSEAQARALAITDNRLNENSKWDDALLTQNLKELVALKLDFNVEVTGFSMAEIDLRIEGAKPKEEADAADAVPTPGPSVSQVGDLWLLGAHRVLCGDATSGDAFARLMGEDKAAAVIVDPPFNVPVQGHVGGKGRIKHREFVMASGDMTSEQFTEFLIRALSLLAKYSKAGSLHFVAMDWRHLLELFLAGQRVYAELKNLCTWTKPTPGMGSLYRSQSEHFAVFKTAGGKHRNNIQLGRYGRSRSNVWAYPGVTPFGQATDEGNLLAMHPTVKPVRLIADAILDCTVRGDIVLDSFLGSGTAVIASERVGRICRGMDLDPGYVDTAVRRWQAWTGEQALHEASGKTFDQVAKGARRGR